MSFQEEINAIIFCYWAARGETDEDAQRFADEQMENLKTEIIKEASKDV